MFSGDGPRSRLLSICLHVQPVFNMSFYISRPLWTICACVEVHQKRSSCPILPPLVSEAFRLWGSRVAFHVPSILLDPIFLVTDSPSTQSRDGIVLASMAFTFSPPFPTGRRKRGEAGNKGRISFRCGQTLCVVGVIVGAARKRFISITLLTIIYYFNALHT